VFQKIHHWENRPVEGHAAGRSDPAPTACNLPNAHRPVACAYAPTLVDVCARLESAYATCVTARQVLLAQACDHDPDIARCLAGSVIDVLTVQLRRLRGLVPRIPPIARLRRVVTQTARPDLTRSGTRRLPGAVRSGEMLRGEG
jgi:hypothetical protein